MNKKVNKKLITLEDGQPVSSNQLSDPETWVDQYGNYLFGYAILRLHDYKLAEDMVQETFLAALQARNHFLGQSSERTWLMGILKHKILDQIRKNSREFMIYDVESSVVEVEEFFDKMGRLKATSTEWTIDPSMVLEQKEFQEVLKQCLSELPSRLAIVFSLREMDGLSSEEICNMLNISKTNLRVMFHRARLQLRLCLETRWFNLRARRD
jgi:RNA polymerase sigma-70 factor (ECF subfamily)